MSATSHPLGDTAGLNSARLRRFRLLLGHRVDGSSLAAFRILFGSLMVWYIARAIFFGRVAADYISPPFHFTYELFPFLHPWPGSWMYVHFVVMGLAAAGVALGLFYRTSAVLLFMTYAYVFLLDKAYYNNHYYLIVLMASLMMLADGAACWSLDNKRSSAAGDATVPFWNLFLLRAQLVVMYFYGGIAKLHPDWLSGDAMRIYLSARSASGNLPSIFASEWAVNLISYGGLAFDLFIGFALLWKRTRYLAVPLVILFHLTNGLVLYDDIDIFPYLGIASTIVFLEPDSPRRLLDRLRQIFFGAKRTGSRGASPQIARPSQDEPCRPIVCHLVILYLAVQALVPLRHWLYPGNVGWTEEGSRFAWRMKVHTKPCRAAFRIFIPRTEGDQAAAPDQLLKELTPRQNLVMGSFPDMILQYAHHLKERLEREGVRNPHIYAEAWAKLNARPQARVINPSANLAEARWTPFRRTPWIMPMPPRTGRALQRGADHARLPRPGTERPAARRQE